MILAHRSVEMIFTFLTVYSLRIVLKNEENQVNTLIKNTFITREFLSFTGLCASIMSEENASDSLVSNHVKKTR